MNSIEITINAHLVFEIFSKRHWVNSFPGALPELPKTEKYLWIDSQGNTATCGEDFKHAEKIQSYPIKIYWIQRVSHLDNEEYFKSIAKILNI